MEAVKEADPLKQGLKHWVIFETADVRRHVKEADPLKQGLKHNRVYIIYINSRS